MNNQRAKQSMREKFDMEDEELNRYYLEAKVSRLEEDNGKLKQDARRLEEEKQILLNENSNLLQNMNILESEKQRLKEQIAVLEEREDPEARRRMDFLRWELVSLIDRSVELQRDGAAECIPRAEGETGEMAVNAWKQRMIDDMESRWSQVNSGNLWHFLGAVLHLCVLVHYMFLRLGQLCGRGIIKAEAAASSRRLEGERKEMERNRRREEDNLAALRKAAEKQLSDEKAAVNKEVAALREQTERELSMAKADAEKTIAGLRDAARKELSDEKNATEKELAALRKQTERDLASRKAEDERKLAERIAAANERERRRQKELDDQEAALEKRKAELESKLRALTYWRAIAIVLILCVAGALVSISV